MFFATSVCFALCFSTDNKRLFFGFVLLIFPLLRHFFYAVFYRLLFFANEFTNGVGIYGEKQSRATTEREPQTKTFFHFFLRVALYRLFAERLRSDYRGLLENSKPIYMRLVIECALFLILFAFFVNKKPVRTFPHGS